MRAFDEQNINPNVLATQYAVRGRLVLEANEIDKQIQEALKAGKPNPYPFDKVVYCNIGNPQFCNQPPLTYVRQIISMVEFPPLLDHPEIFPKDLIDHAKTLVKATGCDGTTGAYSHSMGVMGFRKSVCEFIGDRDGDKPSPEDIFITDGASTGIKLIMNVLLSHQRHGIMIPIPQYPLYSATIATLGGTLVPYYLDESKMWATDMESVREMYDKYTKQGTIVKGFVVINPGNPTGQVLTVDNMKEIIEFCYERKLCLMADEVYQENIWSDVPFTSFRKVLHTMRDEVRHGLELISFFSVSKGYYGECGKRGGYFQLENINQFARSQLYKMVSVNLCSNVVGQEVVELICNPPKEGDESFPLYKKEKEEILGSLMRKAKLLANALNECEGISCNPACGALYLFPKIDLPQKFVDECLAQKEKPDEIYCLNMLKKIGVCVVPGSGFEQKEGTYHYRMAFLPPEDQVQKVADSMKKFHNEFMEQYE
ncbi:alanine aminotransferase, putative [Entamoeba invadens IP1]|uniref:Alanine aminotransferase, putative n=1 Tax=Entamoeba invadens IP1 TaxID=370355 RepID=A0A0A1UBX5_ENTIV|nr:alanine aminotransferase, putative [Entamoeba invadens IP1]ELP91213.1 alanine aminotransferase, putative [Entamoeba invadens IP1]|eukprot:XP_004257984.1 alanine aminotransferase, putative [Entamoeba invadens IP1]